jgi:hypothetical protein
MTIDLTEEETTALVKELRAIIDNDRYFLSPRIQMLKGFSPKSGQSPPASHCRHLNSTLRHARQQREGAAPVASASSTEATLESQEPDDRPQRPFGRHSSGHRR